MPAPDLEELTSRFFARWAVSFETMTAAFTEVLAPDCVWEQRPVVTHSRRGALGFLRLARRFLGLESVVVEVRHLARDGDTVLTDRVDHMLRADGTLIASVPIVGVLSFRGTELVAWRDHMGVPAMVGRIVLGTVRRRPLRPTGSDD